MVLGGGSDDKAGFEFLGRNRHWASQKDAQLNLRADLNWDEKIVALQVLAGLWVPV
ncbi:hypothetical protein CCP3SC1_20018 [Gammaproteobacteria bacterium]